MRNIAHLVIAGLAATGAMAGISALNAASEPASVSARPGDAATSIRRLTEEQYRNAIADIFGADIEVNGRFEPILRPTHELLAIGSTNASITPAGLEQFDAMGRAIAAQVFDEKHRGMIMPCNPKDALKPDDVCARETLLPIGRLLFRRPLSAREQDIYLDIAREGASKAGTFVEGLQLALASMLVSPDFLYIVETAEPDPDNPGGLRLDSYSRAARISFILFNTTPDDVLLAAAEAGELTDAAKLDAIATRMVNSPRFADGVKAFFSDMLMYEKFDDMTKDPIIYPRFNLVVGRALAEQMQRTILDTVLTRNEDYRNLFTTRRTVLTRELGPLYEARVALPTGWQPYEFPDDGKRAGLLSQAGFMALYAHPGRSSATLRGRAVRELLMCQPVPEPPGNVDFKVVQDTTNTSFPTARMRIAEHASDPVCAGCHKITDPIGLTLETFDGSGAFRLQENGAPIDNSGSMDGVSYRGASGLGKQLAANPAITECVSQRAIEYATGRLVGDRDITPIHDVFAASGYKIKALFRQVVTDPSLYRMSRPNLGGNSQKVASSATNLGAIR